jgi:hypothetical protein
MNKITVNGSINKANEDYTPNDLMIKYNTTGVIIHNDSDTSSIHDKEPTLYTHEDKTITSDRLLLIDKDEDDDEIMYEFVIDDSIADALHITYDKHTNEYTGFVEEIRTTFEERFRKINNINND